MIISATERNRPPSKKLITLDQILIKVKTKDLLHKSEKQAGTLKCIGLQDSSASGESSEKERELEELKEIRCAISGKYFLFQTSLYNQLKCCRKNWIPPEVKVSEGYKEFTASPQRDIALPAAKVSDRCKINPRKKKTLDMIYHFNNPRIFCKLLIFLF